MRALHERRGGCAPAALPGASAVEIRCTAHLQLGNQGLLAQGGVGQVACGQEQAGKQPASASGGGGGEWSTQRHSSQLR